MSSGTAKLPIVTCGVVVGIAPHDDWQSTWAKACYSRLSLQSTEQNQHTSWRFNRGEGRRNQYQHRRRRCRRADLHPSALRYRIAVGSAAKGSERVALEPSESKTLTFPLGKDKLQYWNPQTKQWIVEPSDFDVWAGEDSTASLHTDLVITQQRERFTGS